MSFITDEQVASSVAPESVCMCSEGLVRHYEYLQAITAPSHSAEHKQKSPAMKGEQGLRCLGLTPEQITINPSFLFAETNIERMGIRGQGENQQ